MVCARNIERSKGGFTLVELLISIGIVAILASLLFTATGSLKNRSQQTSCLAKMKQLGNAIQLYRSENEGRLPPNKTDNPGIFPTNIWSYQIHSYLNVDGQNEQEIGGKMSRLLSCPSEKSKDAWNWWNSDYSANATDNTVFGYDGEARRPKLDAPSKTMMLIETGDRVRAIRGGGTYAVNSVSFRHGTHANVMFFDSHVESIEREDIPMDENNVFWTGRELQ